MSTLVITIISLCAIGVVSAVILYLVAQKFKVEEDPRIDIVESLLPGANCGGCGYPGCRGLAEATVKADSMEGILCPMGGAETMNKIAAALGREVKAQAPKIAVVRCNGSCANRPRTNQYDGARSCAIEHSLYIGETGCGYGCLGCGDCVTACPFDAIHMDPQTQLPVVDDAKCVACGACVKACPRSIIELRNKGPKDRRVFVSCINKDKGGVARKACKVACIGCGKCAKECPFGAITVENNLAYIDYTKCRLCRKCVGVCPTGAIHEINFPPRKTETEATKVNAAPKAVTNAQTAEQASKPLADQTSKTAEATALKETIPTKGTQPEITRTEAVPEPIGTIQDNPAVQTKEPVDVKMDDNAIPSTSKMQEQREEESKNGVK